MKSETIQILQSRLDSLIRRIHDEDVEFWFARDIMETLGYARWENFKTAIRRAVESCETTGYDPDSHFRGVTKMVRLGSGAERASVQRRPGVVWWSYDKGHERKVWYHPNSSSCRLSAHLTIAAKNLATEMTNHNVQQDDLQGRTYHNAGACAE